MLYHNHCELHACPRAQTSLYEAFFSMDYSSLVMSPYEFLFNLQVACSCVIAPLPELPDKST